MSGPFLLLVRTIKVPHRDAPPGTPTPVVELGEWLSSLCGEPGPVRTRLAGDPDKLADGTVFGSVFLHESLDEVIPLAHEAYELPGTVDVRVIDWASGDAVLRLPEGK